MKNDNIKFEKYLEAATAEMDVDHCTLDNSMSASQILESLEDFFDQLPSSKKKQVIRSVHSMLMGKVKSLMHGDK